MTDKLETIALPALAGLASNGANIEIVRSLTDADLEGLGISKTVYGLAAPVMQMFGILALNYGALQEFAAAFSSSNKEIRNPQMDFNRHVLNYLASANALIGHFSTTFKQRTRAVGNPTNGFDNFCRGLKSESDIFEFFYEFRNHALHVGLPVGYTLIGDSLAAGRTVSVVHKTSDLLRDGSKELKSCRLLASVEEIDLLPQIEKYHGIFMTRVFKFIVDTLMPGLDYVNRFHSALSVEVNALGVDFRPAIMTERIRNGDEFKWEYELIPVNFLEELGISFKT